MKEKEIVKKGLSVLLTGSMLLSGISLGSRNMQTVQAAGSSTPNVTKYATKAQLKKTFDLDGRNDTVGKVYLGTSNGTPLQWYIAGRDNVSGTEGFNDDNIVLFSTQHFEDTQFQTSSTGGNDYTGSYLETEINNLCYGGSKAKFTKEEDLLILQTPLMYDCTSSPKLYAPNLLDSSYNGFITVGATDSLRIDKQYYEESCQAEKNGTEYLWDFWIRKTFSTESNSPFEKLYAYSVNSAEMTLTDITYHCRIVPAFALNLTSVLFASAAQTGSASAQLQDAMTLRMDGSSKIASKAKYTDTAVTVTKDDKDTGLYLYVQGNNGEDWVYSKEIMETGTVTSEDIKSSLNGNDTISLINCKIWLETTSKEENLTYAVMAAKDSASGEGQESGGTQQSDKEVLESLNFKLSEDSSYKTDDITPGRQYVQEYDELICSIYDRNTGSRKVYIEDGKDRIIKDDENKNALLGEFPESESYYKYRYSMSTTFDRDGDGCKDSLATICLHRNGGYITMDVMDLESGEMIMKNQQTGGFVNTATYIQPWDYVGLLSITAGDYDGDGKEEVAVYTPNNCYVKDGSSDLLKAEDYSKLEISIFRITENSKELGKAVFKIEIADEDNCPNWRTAKNTSGNRYYWYIPYVSMDTADLNHDGKDDLLTMTSFQEKHILSKDSYTWNEVMDPNTCLGSVLDIYEGNDNGIFNQTVNKKVLLSYNEEDSNPYGLLRNASVTVANVTGAGSEEITFAGALTKVNYNASNVTSDTVVAGSKILLHDSNSEREGTFAPRIGYVKYNTLKKDEGNRFSSMDYTWTKSFTLCNQKVYLDEDNANDLITVTGYASKGRNYADTIAVGSDRFRYDNDANQLTRYGSVWNHTEKKTSNRWYGQAVVGNVNFSQDGKEELFFVYYMKVSGKDTYHTDIWRVGDENVNAHVWWNKVTDNFLSLNVGACDVNQDSMMIEYTDGNSELFYSDPEILSVLQAAPVYEELGQDYTGDAETSYSKSSGSGKGNAYESVVSAGVVAGFEKEFNILGFQSVGGVEMEASVSAAFGRSSEYTTSKTYTTTYNTTGTEDVALLYATPYVRYNCKMFIPAYDMPSEEEYNAKKAFASELKEHLEKCVEQRAAVTGGVYATPAKGDYNVGYTTNVSPATYEDQLVVYNDYLQWIENTEKSIKSFEQGGTCEWSQHMEAGWQDYFYNMPQTPIVTTIPVSTYDQIAAKNPKLDTIADAVFGENYRSGDPATYPQNISDIEKLGGTNILSGKSGMENAADDTGFIYSTAISASGSCPSQSIAIDEESATTISRGIATEATFKVKAGDVYAGVTASAEMNSSATCSTTLGCEYSGTVPNLPEGTPASYGYGWKLVSYNMDVNGNIIPVVGYVTKMTNQAPPSVASNLKVTAETDNSITIAWENGIRPAHHYDVYRVDVVKKENVYTLLKKGVTPDEKGICTFTDDDGGNGLFYDTQYSYTVVSYNEDESLQSVYSEEVTGRTTIPDMEFVATVEGVVEGKEYVPNTVLSMKVDVDNNSSQDITWRVRSYNWEYSDGSSWQSADAITKNMNLVVDRSMDGRKYRCKVNLYAGSSSNGKDYEIYTKPVTVSVKRYKSEMTLTGEKIGNPVEESAAYGPVGDQLQITATVSSDDILVTGGKVIFALYKGDAKEAVTIEANVSEQGIAKAEIPITETGNYHIKAQYEACEPLENCDAVKEYTYYAYEGGTTPDFTISGDNQAKIDTTVGDIVYTGDEINPEIELMWNGTSLQEGKDYNVEYLNNMASGTATANIIGVGNFENMEQQTVDFIIKQAKEVPNVPDIDFNVGVSCVDLDTLNELLPEGWSVQGDNEELVIGEAKTVTIVYTGNDAANYTNQATREQITVTRADHEHAAGDVLYNGKEDIIPTCITEGVGHTECTVCGCTLKSGIKTALDASGHKWSDTYTLDYEATCVEKGKESIHCEKCNAIKAGTTRECGELKSHTGGTATCTTKAVCKVCHMEYGALKDHAWDEGEITKKPTETEEGKKTYTCSVCKKTQTEAIPVKEDSSKPDVNPSEKKEETKDPNPMDKDTETKDPNPADKDTETKNPEKQPLPVGTTDKSDDGKATYKVTASKATNGTVTYVAPTNKKATSVAIPDTVTVGGITYKVTAIDKNAFKENKNIKSVTIGKNITTIGANAFYNCTKLKTVKFGSNVTTIGDKAFYKCTALTKVSLPSKTKTIGKSAFEGCKKVTSITIGKNLEKIGSKVFYGCSKVKTLTIKSTKLTTKKVGSKAFGKTPNSMTVKIPKKKWSAYKSMLIKCGVNKKAKLKKS